MQTVKGYLPVQHLPWKRGPSTWLLSQTLWKCRMIMPPYSMFIYKWKWWPPKQMGETCTLSWEKFLHSRITQRNSAEPHDAESNNQLDLGVCEISRALVHGLISRCDVKNTTIFCHLLLLAELWRTAWTIFKLLSLPLPITFLDLKVLFSYWHLHYFILHVSSDYT